MKNDTFAKALKCICFAAIAIALFAGIQTVLTPKWRYPAFDDAPEDMMKEFYQAAEGADIQAVFLGTSHMEFGADPMKIYEETGIVSFNLASSTQPLPVSCALCAEMFAQNCDPNVVILDVSKLFQPDFFTPAYRYLLENMKLGAGKVQLAKAFAAEHPKEKQLNAFLSAFFPIYEYHDRWTELTDQSFKPVAEHNLYRKGHFIMSNIFDSGMDADEMNAVAEIMHSDNLWEYELSDGGIQINESTDVLYRPELDDRSVSYLLAIKELCAANGAKLILTKIPAVGAPQSYGGAWTKIKSELVHEFAETNGLEFLDLLYDVDLAIDWAHDSADGGRHLNFNGARKVSAFFADYLQNECGLTGSGCEIYDKDIPIYDSVCRLADLQMTSDLTAYLTRLLQLEDVTVLFSASDDMISGLTQAERDALDHFGLHTDRISFRSSFLAVKECGTLVYEAASNHNIEHQGRLAGGNSYSLISSGWLTMPASAIVVDTVDYSMNARGLNIVVLDNASGLVWDSVAFDTCSGGDHPAIRDYSRTEKLLREYEEYLMIQDAKSGIGA